MIALVFAAALAAEPVTLTLDEATTRLREAPDLTAATARAAAAAALARQARAAGLPTLAAGGAVLRNDHDVVFDFGALLDQLPIQVQAPDPVTMQPLEMASGSVSARVPVFAPTAWAEARSAERGAQAAAATVEEAQATLEATLVALAAGAEAARGAREAADRAVALAERRQHVAEVARAAGTGTDLEVLAAKADVARRRGEALSAQAEADRLADALGVLIGVDGPVAVTLPDHLPTDGDGDRATVRAAALQIDAAAAREAAAWWRHAPVIAATGQASTQTTKYATGYDYAWRVGVEAQWTLYDGGFRYGKLDQARADRAAAEATLAGEQLKVAREQRDAERNAGVATQQLAVAEEQAAAASAAAAIADKGLAAGTVTPLYARQAADDAFRAEVGVAAARARLRAAEAELRRARGGGP